MSMAAGAGSGHETLLSWLGHCRPAHMKPSSLHEDLIAFPRRYPINGTMGEISIRPFPTEGDVPQKPKCGHHRGLLRPSLGERYEECRNAKGLRDRIKPFSAMDVHRVHMGWEAVEANLETHEIDWARPSAFELIESIFWQLYSCSH